MIVLAFLIQVLRIAVPYLFAAAGGALSERAGVIALSLEGFMLTGAFCAALGAHYTGSPWMGLVAGVAGGALIGLLHAIATVRFGADQVVVGIAINLLVIGLTRFFLLLAFDSSSNSPRVAGFGDAGGIWGWLSGPMLPLGLIVIPLVAFLVDRTAYGLRVRAVGEHPQAATSLGVSVKKTRYGAVVLAGALASLGGVYLALDQHQFTDQMTAGRGFIALAAIIFGRWDPKRAGIACLLFAFAEALQIRLQAFEVIPSQFVGMIPYLLTIIALAGVVGRANPPAALGKAE